MQARRCFGSLPCSCVSVSLDVFVLLVPPNGRQLLSLYLLCSICCTESYQESAGHISLSVVGPFKDLHIGGLTHPCFHAEKPDDGDRFLVK